MLRPRSQFGPQPTAEGGVSGLIFIGTMLVLVGGVATSLAISMNNRERRKSLHDKVEVLDKQVGVRSTDLAHDMRARSSKLKIRMSNWKAEAQQEFNEKLSEVSSWQLAHGTVHQQLAELRKKSAAQRLTRQELEAGLARLEAKLAERQDAAINLVKGGVVKLQSQADRQAAAKLVASKERAVLATKNKQLAGRIKRLTTQLDALRNAQAKDRQAAGTQGVKVAADLSKLSNEAGALRKALAAQARRIAELEQAAKKDRKDG